MSTDAPGTSIADPGPFLNAKGLWPMAWPEQIETVGTLRRTIPGRRTSAGKIDRTHLRAVIWRLTRCVRAPALAATLCAEKQTSVR
jgi:hypothetical protein